MASPLSPDRQRQILRAFAAAALRRRQESDTARDLFREQTAAVEREYIGTRKELHRILQIELARAQQEWEHARQNISERYDAAQANLTEEYRQKTTKVKKHFAIKEPKLREEYQNALMVARSRAEQQLRDNDLTYQKRKQLLKSAQRQREQFQEQAETILKRWRVRMARPKIPPVNRLVPARVSVPGPAKDKKPLRERIILRRRIFCKHQAAHHRAEAWLKQMQQLRIAPLVSGWRFAVVCLVMTVAIMLPTWIAAPDSLLLVILSGCVSAALVPVIWWILRFLAKIEIQQTYYPFLICLKRAKYWSNRSSRESYRCFEAREKAIRFLQAKGVRTAHAKFRPQLKQLRQKREDDLKLLRAAYEPKLAEYAQRRAAEEAKADKVHETQATSAREMNSQKTAQLDADYAARVAALQAEHQAVQAKIEAEWSAAVTQAQELLGEQAHLADMYFPEWELPPPGRQLPLPSGMRFGTWTLDTALIPEAVVRGSDAAQLLPAQRRLPAMLPFSNNCALLIRTSDKGRAEAVALLQAIMLRFLLTLPPGQARLTIFDPVTLGEQFAGFMHLADFDEALVNSRIWTEAGQIEKRLADLTGHMENVLQKYLRNQFKTIDEYNEAAGEVAEAFRILVVANFPTNFTPESARRLLSVVNSGPSCGVCPIISVDTRAPMPQDFKLADLEQACVVLTYKDGRFVWKDTDFSPFVLKTDAPPASAELTALLRQIGERAKSAKRVEVPFSFISPPPEQWWTGDTRAGVDIPLGRAGATRRQHMRLGVGTAQHVVIAGKTGSGKSTLLHVLITNLALTYSPDEIELYLIDFKKGVEFKTYAASNLPHARVVAIESEREFGLSVLQRLDNELRRRGELFRQANVVDVKSFRNENPDQVLPRVLLIVDEFQEFFSEDDRLAGEASLLLDRLVRQGRAFGLHVILGSQTLGGAYSLARSTIDQMAVRVALQCSEADAGLILSKDNAAARLLSRPGEAIYNDANGLLEGNDPFQIVWLSDEERDEKLAALAARRPPKPGRVVFEGTAPAELRNNAPLMSWLHGEPRPAPLSDAVWLGEPIAIKDPTAAVFKAQGGANLMILGQQPETGLGVLGMAVLSVALQHRQTPAHIHVLDGTPADSPSHGVLAGVCQQWAPAISKVWPRRELPELLEMLDKAVKDRQATDASGATPIYLLINGLQQFRDLRRDENDFGFSRFGEERRASPSQLFASILREGPPNRVHVLFWCDTLTSLQRHLDRQSLRDVEIRVLFQMSAADSSTLIDTPAAGKLGMQRALLVYEEQGPPEKFRPYPIAVVRGASPPVT